MDQKISRFGHFLRSETVGDKSVGVQIKIAFPLKPFAGV